MPTPSNMQTTWNAVIAYLQQGSCTKKVAGYPCSTVNPTFNNMTGVQLTSFSSNVKAVYQSYHAMKTTLTPAQTAFMNALYNYVMNCNLQGNPQPNPYTALNLALANNCPIPYVQTLP